VKPVDRIFDWLAIVASVGGLGCLAAPVLLLVASPAILLLSLAYAALHWAGAL